MTDIRGLIEKAQKGDEKAIAAIVEKYKGLVVSLARSRYLTGGDLEDLIQEGTLGLLKAIRQYSPQKGDFGKYAYIGIINKINDAVRADNREKNKALNDALRQKDANEQEGEAAAHEDNPLTVFLLNEKRERFYDNLRAIVTHQQMSIVTLYLEGYTYKEISDKLNITEKKVDNALHAIKNKIRKSETTFLDESGN
ncbi:MAG: sigma-70 family RNA polymerase sigma factor [Christensenellales bacterium]|jgi:RNA polymerase sporulation-specific sigma factor